MRTLRSFAALSLRLHAAGRRWVGDRRGAMAIVFALAAVMLMTAVGCALDLGRTYYAEQQLAQAATLGCQYASRPSVAQLAFGDATTAAATYTAQVTSFVNASVASQHLSYSQTNATPFTYTAYGAGVVSLSASVPMTIMNIIGVRSLPVGANITCFTTPPGSLEATPDATASVIMTEGFENSARSGSNVVYYNSNGTPGFGIAQPAAAVANQIGYIGTTGTEWLTTGYCLEVDAVGKTQTTVPEGTHSGELDCENGSDSKGNSSISTKVYLQAQTYELRWSYAGRITNNDYDPAYICGSAASDISWAGSTNFQPSNNQASFGAKTNQINVYLDASTSSLPPTHTTLDGTQSLAGANLIDACVYSGNWIQRSVIITVTTPGYYWLSFAADGTSDSFGGDLDQIQFCVSACAGKVADNFPAAWLNNPVLFEDTFESPAYSGTTYITTGDMSQSLGTSGSSSSGWPASTATGWALAPYNQTAYWLNGSGCPQGKQCVELGWNNASITSNSFISRPFLLVPGYYQVSWRYISEETFSNLSGVYCGATPSAARIPTLSGQNGTATNRALNVSNGTHTEDTNTVGVFMSHAQLASTPNLNAYQTSTVYTNPDGSTSSTATVPPNGISLTSYNASQPNPLLDICGYSTTAQTRTVNVKIQKPAYYWLTLAALGANDGFGGQIDDVKLTALGSPVMSGPPSSFVTIPVPNPQVHSAINFTGFSVLAEAQYQ